jgi:protein-disulfide isomerase
MSLISAVSGSGRLAPNYIITYGNPKAPIQIVEYISFGCAPCIQLFAEEFEGIRSAYIETGKVYWVFHPHPVDLVTVHAMVCLEALSDHQKRVFLEAIVLEQYHTPNVNTIGLMHAAMDILQVKIPNLEDASALQKTSAFKAAFTYQQHLPAFTGTPTITINGKLIDEFPTRKWIDQLIQTAEGTL